MSGMSKGLRELLISSAKTDSEGVLIAVQDSGPGLAPEALERPFEAFYTTKPALRRSDLRPATLRHHERRIDEAFRFIQGAFVAKLVGYIHQHSPQNFIAAPGLKAPMNGFVIRIALRQHVPLRASVEYPQYSFENT